MEEKTKTTDIILDEDEINSEILIPVQKEEHPKVTPKTIKKKVKVEDSEELINCLKNIKIIVRHIPKENGFVNNPKHVLYGGMAEGAFVTYVVPQLSSGIFVNVLTNKEKEYLEYIMGLEDDALSIYKRVNNFWDTSNEEGISSVTLTKQDNYLDLSIPEEYIKYKILLANKNFIAPSLQVLEDRPKATYKYVIISEDEINKSSKDNLNIKMKCYKEYGKIENDINTLRTIIETIDGRPTAVNTKIEFLQAKMDNLIQVDSKLFYRVITDPYLETKVFIKRCIEAKLISNRNNLLYLVSDGSPLCELNEESTINIAARFLSSPKRQDLRFSLEAKLKQ